MHFCVTHLSTIALDSEERSSFRGPVQDFRGILLWPSPPNYGYILYFEEKVHKKKLQRGDVIPLLFPRLLCQILEHLGYPSDPQLERSVLPRGIYSDKWTNMTTYRVEQPGRPQPAARKAPPRHIPEGIPIASPTISRAPPVTPASSEPSTSTDPRMTIPISEYRELCRSLQTLTTSQSSLAQEMQLFEHARSKLPHSQATESQAPPEAATEEVFEIDITQEVPLPLFNFNHPYHIEDNAQLGWGEMRKKYAK
ncbi:hypothetical protein CK203_083167 [Vitis vinifera]|uniref:Uncharacterized protein n=1 Tax=Vitis vinifera TaxID=29760 RepID=A0A438DWU5_VITVI|nr:hypothetical protein CK203_083167 [Vitis vinifera]